MPHDTHFLERLSRVSQAQAGRALSLYRDPELVRAVLSQATVGEGVERVAIALERSSKSPHVIVDRAGHFITCLSAGMSVAACPVVSRDQLDGVTFRTGRERTARELLDEAKERGPGGMRRLFHPLNDHVSQVSQEEIQPLLMIAPLLAEAFLGETARTADKFMRYLPSVDTRRHSPGALREELSYLWTLHGQLGHYALLTAEGAQGQNEALLQKIAEGLVHLLLFGAIFQPLVPTAARILWAINRLGRWTLPVLKRKFQENHHPDVAVAVGAGLVTVGLGHARFKAEVIKVLEHDPDAPGEIDAVEAAYRGFLRAMRPLWLLPLEDAAATAAERSSLLQRVLVEGGTPASPDVGDDPALAPAFTLNLPVSAFDVSSVAYSLLLSGLPWLARASATELYLPPEAARLKPLAFSPEAAAKLVEAASEVGRSLVDEPVRAPPKPGRNELCPCGSGKKHKKCCGQ